MVSNTVADKTDIAIAGGCIIRSSWAVGGGGLNHRRQRPSRCLRLTLATGRLLRPVAYAIASSLETLLQVALALNRGWGIQVIPIDETGRVNGEQLRSAKLRGDAVLRGYDAGAGGRCPESLAPAWD
jgi:hypothetical protein